MPSTSGVRKPGLGSLTRKATNTSMKPPTPINSLYSAKNRSKQPISNSLRMINYPKDVAKVAIDQEELESIFIQMCFYARLAFVQPPCCLKCAFQKKKLNIKRDGVDENADKNDSIRNSMNSRCKNLVVWRLDARTSLQPKGLDENTVLVTCSTAQALLRGESVQNMKWDAKERKLSST